MKVALVSLNQVWENKVVNLQTCCEYVKKGQLIGADLIIFPEMTLTGFSMNLSKTAEDQRNSESVNFFSSLSQEFGIAIIFGVVFQGKPKASNNAVFVNTNGAVLDIYAKIHPFSLSGENNQFTAGNKLCIVAFESFNIGITICYDLRFPELYSALAKRCDLIVNIASWPASRIEHWDTLLKARAIENQVFMIGVNRTGVDDCQIAYERSSTVIAPDGVIMQPSFSEKDMSIFEITKEQAETIKMNFSTTQDRIPSFYKTIL